MKNKLILKRIKELELVLKNAHYSEYKEETTLSINQQITDLVIAYNENEQKETKNVTERRIPPSKCSVPISHI